MNGGAHASFAGRSGRRYHDELPANDPCIPRLQHALRRLSDRLLSYRAGRRREHGVDCDAFLQALVFCSDAFSSREPVPTSLENALSVGG
jgi:hypothetical protein